MDINKLIEEFGLGWPEQWADHYIEVDGTFKFARLNTFLGLFESRLSRETYVTMDSKIICTKDEYEYVVATLHNPEYSFNRIPNVFARDLQEYLLKGDTTFTVGPDIKNKIGYFKKGFYTNNHTHNAVLDALKYDRIYVATRKKRIFDVPKECIVWNDKRDMTVYVRTVKAINSDGYIVHDGGVPFDNAIPLTREQLKALRND
jgi:hypothetical protein